MTDQEVEAALAKLAPESPTPASPSAQASVPVKDALAAAWKALTIEKLLELLTAAHGEGWSIVANRLEGPCPVRKGKCSTDARSAFAYPSTNGYAPHVRCGHRESCGFDESLFEALARAAGGRAEAAKRIKDAAGVGTAKLDEVALAAARVLAEGLPAKVADDAGAPFERPALAALALLLAHDAPAWARVRAGLKKADVPMRDLDAAVKKAAVDSKIAETTADEDATPEEEDEAASFGLADPEPWPEPIDGARLLDEVHAASARYLVVAAQALVALALWALHTWAIEACENTPRLAITSPQPRCGKSRVLAILARLSRRALLVSNVTTAALFRTIEKFRPTMLIDEADTFLGENEELRGVLNAGFEPDGAVIRTVGEEHEPQRFSAFAAAALAAIGRLPATLDDRSIKIPMKRRLPGEQVDRFRRTRAEEQLEPLRRKAARWAADHLEQLKVADPELPPELDDRAADCWRPLLAIADLAGGDWPVRARAAAVGLSGAKDEGEGSFGAILLRDLRALFAAPPRPERLGSGAIVQALTALEERPWPEFCKGRPISPSALARVLKPFGVRPITVREDKATFKGYKLADLAEAFSRYLPAEGTEAVTGDTFLPDKGLGPPASRHTIGEVTVQEPTQTLPALERGACDGPGPVSSVPSAATNPFAARMAAAAAPLNDAGPAPPPSPSRSLA